MQNNTIDAPPGWTKDAAGNWVQQSNPVSSIVSNVSSMAATIAATAQARSTEASTYAGAAIGSTGITAGDVESLIGAVGLVLAGDIPGAIHAGALPLFRLGTAAAAILIPERKPTDDQIKTAVAALTHDQLISLLDQSVAVSPGAIATTDHSTAWQPVKVPNAAG